MNAIARYEGIVDGLSQFMAQGSDVLELRAENASTDPAGESQYITSLTKSVVFIPGLKIVTVEAQHAALIRVTIGIKKSVRKQERREAPGGDITGVFCCADGRVFIGRTGGEKQIGEYVDVNQDEGTAGAVFVQSELIRPAWNRDGAFFFDGRVEERVPVLLHDPVEGSALNRINPLRGHIAARVFPIFK